MKTNLADWALLIACAICVSVVIWLIGSGQ